MVQPTDIRFPTSPFLDGFTGRPTREWIAWLQNPQMLSITLRTGLSPTSGGTGVLTSPGDGEILIGDGGNYVLGSLTAGAGILVNLGAGTIEVANSGVLSLSCGTTGLTPSTATTGAIVLAGTLNVANGGSGAATLTGYLKGNGTSAFTGSATIPNTDITGLGTMSVKNIGASGSFTTVDLKTVTVTDGIIVSIV